MGWPGFHGGDIKIMLSKPRKCGWLVIRVWKKGECGRRKESGLPGGGKSVTERG